MHTVESLSDKNVKTWTTVQKIAFRFFFIFMGLFSWCCNNILTHVFYPKYYHWINSITVFSAPLFWLDKQFYHIGYNPVKYPQTSLKDSPLSWVTLITIAWISVACSIIWSILDRKRENYSKLNYWFSTYLAYYLFITMDFYAIYKIMMVQMPFPNADYLLMPLGHYSKVLLLFNFVGISPGYSMFSGICELLAALLVLNRRTRVFGCLFMTSLLVNILCFNLFYNVMVKLLIMSLLLITLYLLIPYIYKLVKFFYHLEPVSLSEKQYTFSAPWKKYALMALLLVPAYTTYNLLLRSVKLVKADEIRKQQKGYDVITFVKGTDTLQPLLTDTFRIKKLLFTAYFGHKYAVVYNMKDSVYYYQYIWDNKEKKITLISKRDTTKKDQFNYKELSKDQLRLEGKWKGQNINMQLKKFEIDSLPIVKEKITWVVRD